MVVGSPQTRRGGTEFQDVYDYAGCPRSAIRGFIRYLRAYEQDQRKKGNPAYGPEGTVNSEPLNAYALILTTNIAFTNPQM